MTNSSYFVDCLASLNVRHHVGGYATPYRLISLLLWKFMPNKKPINTFNKPVLKDNSKTHADLQITSEEFNALKQQIALGLGRVRPGTEIPDDLVKAVGEFGCETNPIGCASVPACIAYLNRLITADGHIKFTRLGCITNKKISRYLIDKYALVGNDGIALKTIYMSSYQRRDSKNAPVGFALPVDALATEYT
jgi:hypothetical protein